MAKYDPWRDYLRNLASAGQKEVTLNFENLERILGSSLEKSAHHYPSWWGNDRTHPQARAWLDAGWEKTMVDMETEKVKFQRIGRKASQSDRGKVLPPPQSFTIKCAYCKGKGIDPGVVDLQEHDCPVCKGGWQTLPGSRDDYETCGPCGGNGMEPGIPKNPLIRLSDPHHICHGSGLVKP